MADDPTDSSTDAPATDDRLRLALLIGVPVVLVALVLVALFAFGGDDDTVTDDTSSTSTTSTTAVEEGSDVTEPAEDATTTTSTVPDDGPTTTEAPAPEPAPEGEALTTELSGLTIAFAPDGEVAVCAEAKRRITVFRALAAGTPPGGLIPIREAMTELEANLYTAAEQHDWGDLIIEDLTDARRLWASASSAADADDTAAATTAAQQALESVDAALAVDCPTG